jgi:hypothetical protein
VKSSVSELSQVTPSSNRVTCSSAIIGYDFATKVGRKCPIPTLASSLPALVGRLSKAGGGENVSRNVSSVIKDLRVSPDHKKALVVFTHPAANVEKSDNTLRRPDWEFVLTSDEFGRYRGSNVQPFYTPGTCQHPLRFGHREFTCKVDMHVMHVDCAKAG